MSLFKDLQNRRVFRVAGIYVAVAWGATEILVTVVDQLSLSRSLGTIVVILFVVGFPVAMFLAWVFDVTPEGIQRTAPGTSKSVFTIGLAFVFLIVGTGGLYYFLDSRTQQRAVEEHALVLPLRSVAVLPFEGADADASSDALAVGIADELLIRLGAIPDLKVTGRASSFSEQLHGKDATTIGRMLGVRHLVQGSLRSVGEQIRVNVSIIDAVSGYQVWSDSMNAPQSDLYRVSADLASQVVTALEISVSDDTMERVTHTRRTDPHAYDKYLLGMQKLRDLVGDNTVLAVRYFEEAIAIDPNFARAHAGLSWAVQGASLFARIPPEVAIPRAAESARLAIAIDAELLDGHEALSALDWGFYWDWEAALKAGRRAVALAPGNVDVLAGYGTNLGLTGETDAAIETWRRVAELDPLTPDHELQVGWLLYFAGRAEEAAAQFERSPRSCLKTSTQPYTWSWHGR